MSATRRPDQFYVFRPPFRLLVPVNGPDSLQPKHGREGAALIWCMGADTDSDLVRALRRRPGGVALVAVLPRAEEVRRPPALLELVDQCRPHSLLPHHQAPNPMDLRTLLGEEPDDLPGAVVDYLAWRGLVLDLGLRRTIRRVLELSAELRTVTGVARSLYMSRRALGRRFMKEGLPVPSHWLQFGRVLRAALRLQRPESTLMGVAFDLGYSDGFSLSNQMKRLLGVRPNHASSRLGWEWAVECWIQREIEEGGFSPGLVRALSRRGGSDPEDAPIIGTSGDSGVEKRA
ncbi:MAG: AraC family transcriptional regulator [Gemmatimonadota bacterium]